MHPTRRYIPGVLYSVLNFGALGGSQRVFWFSAVMVIHLVGNC
jgi:hypothetical protein